MYQVDLRKRRHIDSIYRAFSVGSHTKQHQIIRSNQVTLGEIIQLIDWLNMALVDHRDDAVRVEVAMPWILAM